MADLSNLKVPSEQEAAKSLPRWCYFKPSRRKHDSGYNMFEVGYCGLGDKNEAINIQIIGYCDHIWTVDIETFGSMVNQPYLSFDLLTNNYIRVFSGQGNLRWDSEEFALSTMGFRLLPKADTAVTDLVNTGPEAKNSPSNPPNNQPNNPQE